MIPASRDEIDRLIAAGDVAGARGALARLWRQSSTPATAMYVSRRFETLRDLLALTKCRLAILRSFTVEPLIPPLRATAFVAGIDLEVRAGDFNTYMQDALNPQSWLYAFNPDVVIVAVQSRDLAPSLWESSARLAREEIEAAIQFSTDTFAQLIRSLRSHSHAHIILHSLETRDIAPVVEINNRLASLARQEKNVYVLDYDAPIARHGPQCWHDEQKWQMTRFPIAAGAMMHLVREWMRFLHPITGRTCKVLAMDLDNTLWGGVIGEDGIGGIQLDDAFPGAAYRELQRVILDLHRKGVILAIASKNNFAEAMEAIEKHPGMILRPEYFAAFRINWEDKAASLRAIATELNVGIESVAFLDDNPVEREWIREQLPEVRVIDLPDDPASFAQTLRDCPVFERLELTEEDRSRGRYYAEQRMRTQLQQSVGSLEDFYRSLQMRVRIELVTAPTLARAAQLTQKTNQFNLTTRRYSEQELAAIIGSPDVRALTIQVIDRFGDNGIVGLAILRITGGVCEIDTFLLSCRVIGRTVETAFLAAVVEEAQCMGASKIEGWFIPMKKNMPAAEFYPKHGFVQTQSQDGALRWELDLGQSQLVKFPPWMKKEG